MNWIGRTGRGEFILALKPEEVEALYDALDARNDRLEQWRSEPDPEIEEEMQLEEIQRDINETDALHSAFQPIIEEARGSNMNLAFGTNLPNGARVIAEDQGVILAYNNCGTKDEFVTWTWDGKDPKSTCHGHYFRTVGPAARDFEFRVFQARGAYANG